MSILKSKKVMIVKLYYFTIRPNLKNCRALGRLPLSTASSYLSFPGGTRIPTMKHAGTLFLLLFAIAISQSFECLMYPLLPGWVSNTKLYDCWLTGTEFFQPAWTPVTTTTWASTAEWLRLLLIITTILTLFRRL